MKKFAALVAVVALVAFAAPAFAANPFMDVPMNHWAYDAVSQLASRGVVSGYPDGAFKGEWKATRYEMASVVARALAYVDMNKASKQDLELLKKLVVEFKDELDALGVKVDELDSRVALLEDGVGGWKIYGQMRFDSRFKSNTGGLYGASEADFDVNRYRLFMVKTINDTTKFYIRIGAATNNNNPATDTALNWERYYVELKMGWDITAKIGHWDFDWQGDDGLYGDNDAWFTDRALYGYYMVKPFSMGEFAAYITRGDADGVVNETYEYGARVKLNFNENFWFSANGIWRNPDVAANTYVWWGALGVNFTPDWAFKGAYYKQDTGVLTPSAWQVIMDVDQNALGFTSVWLEYASFDNGFTMWTDGPWDSYGAYTGAAIGGTYDSIWFVKLQQKWNDQWTTFERYLKGNKRDAGVADLTNWSFGVVYQYNPAVAFELVYDKYENHATAPDDDMIRLRTTVNF